MIRVMLPSPLRSLAKLDHQELQFNIEGLATQRLVLDAVEARFPMLRGTIRDPATGKRRAFLRFYACERDLSHDSPDTPLPDPVQRGEEPYMVIGGIAGG